MNCAEIFPLLPAYADGELDLVRSLEVEGHLKSCARCAAEKNSIQSLRDALRQNDLAYRAPDSLRTGILKTVRTGRLARGEHRSAGVARPMRNIQLWIWKFIAAGAVAFAVLTILLRPAGISEHGQLLGEAVAAHVRSLQANHLTDVASSDQHTVKPWFDGKLDFAPEVKDFVTQGFPLLGGRLDYLNGRAVAALVYRHDKHLINVFIWPSAVATKSAMDTDRGYSIINFDSKGFHYCLVSDLNAAELNELARLMAP